MRRFVPLLLLAAGQALEDGSGMEVPTMSVDEAVEQLPANVGDMFMQFQNGGGGGTTPTMVAALNEIYLRAMEDRDTLGFRCEADGRQAMREVEDARSGLKQAERSLTILHDQMQSLQASRDRSILELQGLREQFEAKRQTCKDTRTNEASTLQVLTSDLPLAQELVAGVTQSCPNMPPELMECSQADGSYMVAFKDPFMRDKAAKLSSSVEKLLALRLERIVRAQMAPQQGAASFLQLAGHARHLRGRQGRQSRLKHKRRRRLRRTLHDAQPWRLHLLGMETLPTDACKPVGVSTTCESLADQMASFQGGVQDLLDELKGKAQADVDSCRAAMAATTSRVNELKRRADDAGVELANAVAEESEISTGRRESREQVEDLTGEAAHRKKECARRLDQAVSAMGGAKAIARELEESDATLGGASFVGNCEVTDWVSGSCSRACGGGNQTASRRLVRTPPGQLSPLCPPLEMVRACNEVPCPVDGRMGKWGAWSACSRACGTGMQARFRKVLQEARHGGLPTGETAQHQVCNRNPCDQDCVLSDWTAWGNCSKVCNTGHRTRLRQVQLPALVGGSCPAEQDPRRLEARACSKQKCADTPQCKSALDLVLMLDTSGSVGDTGFNTMKDFAMAVAARIPLGEDPPLSKISAVSFSSAAIVQQALTNSSAAFTVAMSNILWDRGNTNTGQALALAGDILARHGRGPAAQQAIVVVTDGMPTSAFILSAEAKRLQQQGVRVSFVLVGRGVGTQAVQNWVSWPMSENVVRVPGFAALGQASTVSDLLSNLCPAFS